MLAPSVGFEPTTSSLQVKRTTNCAKRALAIQNNTIANAVMNGAVEGNRTLLHLLDRQRLSQRATTAMLDNSQAWLPNGQLNFYYS